MTDARKAALESRARVVAAIEDRICAVAGNGDLRVCAQAEALSKLAAALVKIEGGSGPKPDAGATSKDAASDPWLTFGEAAILAGRSLSTVRHCISQGRLKAKKTGQRYRNGKPVRLVRRAASLAAFGLGDAT